MKLTKITILSFVIVLLAGSFVMAQTNEEVAVVNGDSVTANELEQFAQTQQLVMQISQVDRTFAQLLFSSDPGQNLLKEFSKVKLDELINQKLLSQAAQQSNVEVTQEEKDQYFNQQVEQIKQQNDLSQEEFEQVLQQQGISSVEEYKKRFLENSNILVNKFLQNEVYSDINISEEEAKKYYENNKEEFEQSKRVDISHILVEDAQKAQELKTRIENGEEFATVAENNSIDQQSASQGGRLGFIQRGQVIPEFEEAAFNLEVGEVSDVIQTQNGYHILTVNDIEKASQKSFEEVKDQIEETLSNQKSNQKYQEYVQNLRDEANIEINI
ncbi:MAG: peptidyl-prolyl cis-trans isomerase [Halanaerobiales bacterium]|nr:peptidyl-prolyl cis-trans isomerase [Halanaerobiales bacterium]